MHWACTYARCASLQPHCCNLGSPGVNCLLHDIQAAHLRLLVRDGSWVLTTHLQHLPPMLRRGVAMSCVSGRGVVGLGCMSASAADRVSQLSCVDDVSHAAFPSLLVLG